MKKNGILNKDISEVIASMGHLDMITVCDAGLPIPTSARRIDLAVVPGIPSFLDVIKALEKELVVEEIIIAKELADKNPEFYSEIRTIFSGVEIKKIEHSEFKEISTNSKAYIRTGECTPYANVILVSGVDF